MHYPTLNAVQKSVMVTSTFKGYNHNDIISDGEMYDMKNLSSRSYPLLDQRKQRTKIVPPADEHILAISGRDHLVEVIDDGSQMAKVRYNGMVIDGVTLDKSTVKKFVHMGAYTCIWPDRVYFNTADLSDAGSMQRLLQMMGSGISLTMCRGDGTDYDMTQITIDDEPPENPVNGQLWLDTSGFNDALKQYASAEKEWVEVATTFVKISGTGVGVGLKQYDVVTISGFAAPDSASQKVKDQVTSLNNDMIVYGCGSNYFYVAGLLSQHLDILKEQITHMDRTVPDLDFVVESNNRLWGCKYGIENGQAVNEIRASKLGDFRNWKCFMGLSTDSYTASIGSDGPFTGAVTQKSYPIFFKEDCLHRVSGQTPSSFQITTTICRGIQSGSWQSAVVVNELVYYKGKSDVMVYDGSMPSSISAALGKTSYKNARAGTVDGKYFISMEDNRGKRTLFDFDSNLNLWYKEDDLNADYFGTVGDELYILDKTNNLLWLVNGSNGIPEDIGIEWSATFGLFGTDFTNQKYLSRFNIRMQMDPDARAYLEIQYDHSGKWEDQGEIKTVRTRSFTLPVIPKRCDHLQFRIKGTGRCRIYSISRELEVGGDG